MLRTLIGEAKKHGTLPINGFQLHQTSVNVLYAYMRVEPAALRFGWSRTGLCMDLPVFLYSHLKTGIKFLSRTLFTFETADSTFNTKPSS